MAHHTLPGDVTQPFWDQDVSPRLTVASGDMVTLQCPEPCGQVTPQWTANDIRGWDTSRVHALVGSIAVDGLRAGQALEVEILEMQHHGWGWSGSLPGFGLLADDFPDPVLHHWELDGDVCRFGVADIELPFTPFCGCLGVAPGEPGRLHTIPPRVNGGNLDIRDLGPGAKVYLPTFVDGGLFAVGDCHAAQGDGEVCGTGLETPMDVILRLTARPDMRVEQVAYEAPPRKAPDRLFVTTAAGPDLRENAREAVRQMIDRLALRGRLTAEQAYLLCSVAGSLRIAQIVNAPNWTVVFEIDAALIRQADGVR